MTHVARLLVLPLLALGAHANAQEASPMADSVNAFGVDLYRHVSSADGNLFFSPYSISAALGMTREGAEGETAKQMDAVFHFPAADRAKHQATLRVALAPPLVDEWTPEGERKKVLAYRLEVANALWGQDGLPFEPAFLATLKESYGAALERLDFRESDAARERINTWVAEHTEQKIKDIIPPGLPTPDTRLALANAIYFKAAWSEAFQEHRTQAGPFFAPGGEVEAQRMRRVDHLPHMEDETVSVIELDYQGGTSSMLVVLPKSRAGLPAVEKGLSSETLQAWVKGLRHTKVDVQLPRFRFTQSQDLTKSLTALGMPRAFDPEQAEFGGMTRAEPLFIGVVLLKAFVGVDEKGTEAAAATVAMMAAGSAPRPETPVPFVVDRPFLFLIRHKPTGCVLFMGRVTDPTKS